MMKWHSLQGSMASGRVAFESRRENVIDAFVERVTTMDRLFSMRTGLEQAQQKETEAFTQQLARVGGNLQLIAPQEMRDTTERRKVLQQQIKQVEDEVQSIGAGLVGTLDVGATGSILRGRLADLLAAYRKVAPSVKMTVHEQSPTLQIAALLNRTTNISKKESEQVIREPRK